MIFNQLLWTILSLLAIILGMALILKNGSIRRHYKRLADNYDEGSMTHHYLMSRTGLCEALGLILFGLILMALGLAIFLHIVRAVI